MTTQYYHMSSQKLDDGSDLKNPGNNLPDSRIENILENKRPSDCIKRSDAIFVSTSKDFSKHGLPYDQGYIHRVSVSGQTSKHDNAWIGELQRRHTTPENVKECLKPLEDAKSMSDEDVAAKYWKGCESTKANWEILALDVRVVECVSTEPVNPAHTNPKSLEGKIAAILRDKSEE